MSWPKKGFLFGLAVGLAAALGVTLVLGNLKRKVFYPPEVNMSGGLGENTSGQTFEHAEWAKLLAAHVAADGKVNYSGFSREQVLLNSYLTRLAGAQVNTLTKYDQLALYINAYNAFTVRLVIDHPNIQSIKDIPEYERWKGRTWQIGTEQVTLDALENQIIRPRFKEPRIHFALVCASIGCPPLRREPYTGARLNEQLDDQAKKFLATKTNFDWQAAQSILELSSIFDWYAGDFGGEDKLVEFMRPYVAAQTYTEIATRRKNVKVRFSEYDWRLNAK